MAVVANSAETGVLPVINPRDYVAKLRQRACELGEATACVSKTPAPSSTPKK